MFIQNIYPFLSMSHKMIELSKPLKQLDITHFAYSRHYYTGERLWLNTHPAIIENYYKNKDYLIGNTESHPKNYIRQTVLWSALPNQQTLNNAYGIGISHGMFMIEPQDDYCEFFTFGTTPQNYQIINVYLTYLEFIKKFNQRFKETANQLILQAEKHKIALPYHNGPAVFVNSSDSLLQKPSLKKLTSRQQTCAKLLIKVKTAKGIAEELNLSRRTVETYLENLKYKFDCQNKSDLISKLIEFFNINY